MKPHAIEEDGQIGAILLRLQDVLTHEFPHVRHWQIADALLSLSGARAQRP